MSFVNLKNQEGRSMSGVSKLLDLLAGIATQVRAAIEVGVPVDAIVAGARRTNEFEPMLGPSEVQLWDDAPGRMTRNGLGSLEIGSGKTRVDE